MGTPECFPFKCSQSQTLKVSLDQLHCHSCREDMYLFTADQKRPIEDAERKACVVISTYSMLGFTGRRGGRTVGTRTS